MKILVAGANGQLGSEIRNLASGYPAYEFFYTDFPDIDLTDQRSVDALIEKGGFEFIINCAAYTAVDKAETDMESAFKVNRDGVRYLAAAANRTNAFLIHISTDYVFDGQAHQPYKEDEPTEPVSAYGITKLEGEKEVFRNTERAIIIRTSWLYSSYGNNFVRTMLRLGRERGEVSVVSDQLGSPTCAYDLAKAILDIIPKCVGFSHPEIFHYAGQGVISWYDFALAIFELSGITCRVNPILTKDYPTAARRPLYSVLDSSKIRSQFDLIIPDWRDSLQLCLRRSGEINP